MYRIGTAALAALSFASLVGCIAVQEEEEGVVGIAPSALEFVNALNPNALNPNALNPNALDPSALSPAALGAIQAPDAGGDLSRQLLRYVVSCAFDASQSFSFSWTDSEGTVHDEVYWGLLGLAPQWATSTLNPPKQQFISACLASRTNWYGASVTISSRGDPSAINKTDSPELSTYTRLEGAFWGNLFAPSPYLNACYNEANRDHARSLSRDCAAGHLDGSGPAQPCGMINIVGSCDSACEPLKQRGMYYPSCASNVNGTVDSTAKVITVFLP
jgi:hypothetical protein